MEREITACVSVACGLFASNCLFLYIRTTAYFKRTGAVFAGIIFAIFAGAVSNTPKFKPITNAFFTFAHLQTSFTKK